MKLLKLVSVFLFVQLFSLNSFSQLTWSQEFSGPGGGYPRLTQTSDGVLLLGVDADGLRLYKSTNGGSTWSEVTSDFSPAVPNPDVNNPNHSVGNNFTIEAPNGDLLMAYRHLNTNNYHDVENGGTADNITFYNIDVSRSTDGGATWSYASSVINHPDSPNGGIEADRNEGVWEPFLYYGPDGKLWCLYARQNDVNSDGTYKHPLLNCMKRSEDNGLTWGTEEIIVGTSQLGAMGSAGMSEMVQADNGDLITVFETQSPNGNAFSIGMVRSTDNGNTWSAISTVYDRPGTGVYGAGAPYIAKMNDGTLVVSYQVGDNSDQHMGYVTSSDNGYTWTTNYDLFSELGTLWNSLFVDNSGVLYGLTSGVKYKKHYPNEEPTYNGEAFYLYSAKSNKIIGVEGSTINNGSEVKLFDKNNITYNAWTIQDASDGYFYLQLNGTNKILSTQTASAEFREKLILWDNNGGDNQKWYVSEELGYYKIRNKLTGYSVDIWANETTDGTNAILWENLGGKNQLFYAMLTSGLQLNVFDGYVKSPIYDIKGLQSQKSIHTDVNVTNGSVGDIWAPGNWENQLWHINRQSTNYFWLEPANAKGFCLNVNPYSNDDDGDGEGDNIHIWDYSGADNTLWSVDEAENGYVFIVNKKTNKVIDVESHGTDNGSNLHQWVNTNDVNQKWIATPFEDESWNNATSTATQNKNYPDNPFKAFLHPDWISLNPGIISCTQTTIEEGETPAIINSVKNGVGTGTVTYQWQIRDNVSNPNWVNINSNGTNVTYQSAVINTVGIYEYKRIATDDAGYIAETNIITINCLEASNCTETLIAGTIGGDNQVICDGEDPAIFNSVEDATGNTDLAYNWQYSANQIDWYDFNPIITTAELDLPAMTYGVTATTVYYARRCVTDCTEDTLYSNTINMTVNPLLQIQFNNTPTNTLCNNENAILLDIIPAGGTLSGDGIIGNEFVPSNANIGNNIFSYSYTETSTGCSSTLNDTIVVDNCTGVKNTFEEGYFNIYPNPATNNIQLTMSNIQLGGSIEILDITGKVVLSSSLLGGTTKQSVDISTLQNGIYFVKIGNEVKRFVKE